MEDYQLGKIYAIRAPGTEDVYIGSTVEPFLKNRLRDHKKHFRRYNEGKYHYLTSFKLIEREGVYIELLEAFQCNNNTELRKREGEIIKQTPNCINKNIAGRSCKQYYEDNKETIALRKAEAYQARKIEAQKIGGQKLNA
jgi:hypothetical protein